jgi:hypothetical protein
MQRRRYDYCLYKSETALPFRARYILTSLVANEFWIGGNAQISFVTRDNQSDGDSKKTINFVKASNSQIARPDTAITVIAK